MSSMEELQLQVAGGYIEFSLNILYFFEYLITFSQEVEVIWNRQWTVTTWLYVFTRYTSLLFSIWTFVPITVNVCKAGQYLIDALELVQYLCYASFGALRVFAILNGRTPIAAIVFLLGLVPFVTNLFVFAKSMIVYEGNICTSVFALSVNVILKISVIVGDVLITAATWFKTARLYNDARRLDTHAPLAEMLLYDGTIYFMTLLILNVFKMIEQNTPILVALSIASSLISVMTPIIICRFILNLRQVKTTEVPSVSGNLSTRLRFVGNLGQSLETGYSTDAVGDNTDFSHPNLLEHTELHTERGLTSLDTRAEPRT